MKIDDIIPNSFACRKYYSLEAPIYMIVGMEDVEPISEKEAKAYYKKHRK